MKKLKNIQIRFGKYKGKTIKELPDDYLKWCIKEDVLRGKALLYAKWKINYPKDKYKVTVKDAHIGDGEYIVDAWTGEHAISEVRKNNKIEFTQSFYGSSIGAKKL